MKTALLVLCLALSLPCRAQTNVAPADSVARMASSNLGTYTARVLPRVTLHIGKATLNTEVAATPAQEERGLMFRPKLPDNEGMIFLLPKVAIATFWMKNTLIPLSVAFIDKNGVILEIHDMQPGDPTMPDSELPLTRSDSDQVAYALETNLHWFALNGVKPGDKIDPAPGKLEDQALFEQELHQKNSVQIPHKSDASSH